MIYLCGYWTREEHFQLQLVTLDRCAAARWFGEEREDPRARVELWRPDVPDGGFRVAGRVLHPEDHATPDTLPWMLTEEIVAAALGREGSPAAR